MWKSNQLHQLGLIIVRPCSETWRTAKRANAFFYFYKFISLFKLQYLYLLRMSFVMSEIDKKKLEEFLSLQATVTSQLQRH
jgi:hypothetical protein